MFKEFASIDSCGRFSSKLFNFVLVQTTSVEIRNLSQAVQLPVIL